MHPRFTAPILAALDFLWRSAKTTLIVALKIIRWFLPSRYICSLDPSFAGACRYAWAFSASKAAIKAACATGVRQGQPIYVRKAGGRTRAFICHTAMFGLALRGVEEVGMGR